jgi:hypothetical protein
MNDGGSTDHQHAAGLHRRGPKNAHVRVDAALGDERPSRNP